MIPKVTCKEFASSSSDEWIGTGNEWFDMAL